MAGLNDTPGANASAAITAKPGFLHIRGADFSLRLHHIPASRRLKSAPPFFRSLFEDIVAQKVISEGG
jgi:hypothetical protein